MPFLVEHRGLDRLQRKACRLHPRLLFWSPSEHSLFQCSQDIGTTLMPSRVRANLYEKRHLNDAFFLVEHRGLEPLTF